MRTKKGTITSTKMNGTVTVTVDMHAFHPKYKKRYKVSRKFLADPGEHKLHDGDLVLIGECRPLSKNKHFRVVEIVRRAAEVDELTTEKDVEEAMHHQKEAPPAPKAKEKNEEKKEEKAEDAAEEGASADDTDDKKSGSSMQS